MMFATKDYKKKKQIKSHIFVRQVIATELR